MSLRETINDCQSTEDSSLPAIAVLGRERNRVARLCAAARSKALNAFEAPLPLTDFETGKSDVLLVDGNALTAEDRLWIRGLLVSAGAMPLVVVTEAPSLATTAELIADGVDDVLDWATLTSGGLARAVTMALARRVARRKMRGSVFAESTPAPAPVKPTTPSAPQTLTLLQECASAMILVNPDGVVEFANPEAESLLGVPEGSLKGAPFALEVSPDRKEDITLDGPDGKLVQAELRAVDTAHGDIPMRVVTLHDVSLRKALTQHFAA